MKESEIQRIIYLYNVKKMTIVDISKQTHHKQLTVSKILKENGVLVKLGVPRWAPTEEQLNLIKSMLNERESYSKISKRIGVDVSVIKKITKEFNLNYNFKMYNKNLDEEFFDNIDTPYKAWLLGFLLTDGSVRDSRGCCQIRLEIQSSDRKVLEDMKLNLKLDSKIYLDNREKSECVGICFTCKHMFNTLSQYGIVPRKTYITNSLNIEKIPKHLQRDFIRGVFDGDGGITFTNNVNDVSVDFVSYFKTSVEEFQSFIDCQINKDIPTKIRDGGNKYRCTWRGRKQVLKILSYLYDNVDSDAFLQRKYDKYMRLKNYVK